ncbi:MCE family protein [Gordonia sp. HNM0687]|uniref:MCE family protein n=1 Tax=Gordonia mangrovi TaxID=2665643 RepID=A0A6L7GW96_9ACTN|nr:MCE family protein [Gordonia mangrovi]MXP23301.1 MCE family protein [Gordonia mangrovi]UVF76783.1 MCE family protein [Gordonia mangrovi]
MTNRRNLTAIAVVVLVAVVLAAAVTVYRQLNRPTTITADFATTTGIYVGDDVRVAGVEVGTISAIEPQGETVRMTMRVDHGVPIPADARAIIIAQNLVANRFVQLAPAYATSGPVMADGANIPRARTAVPVEWDEVKEQLTRLATDLGPRSGVESSSVGRFIDATGTALADNGDTLGDALRELAQVGQTLSENSGNITDTIANLQTFVTAVRDSGTQIVQFENRLATLSGVLDGSKSDLDAALTNLAQAVGDVQRFVVANRDRASEQIRRLAAVTQNLVDHDDDLEQLLHVFPTNMANFYNIYNPDTGTEAGVFTVNNFSNPVQFICSSVASIENLTAAEGARRCAEYLGPIAPMLTFNYLPVPLNPVLGPTADPDNLIYTENDLRPAQSPRTSMRTRDDLLLPGRQEGTS